MVFHFPPISGGGVIVVANIANTFAELGHEVTVVTPDLEWKGQSYEPKINSNIEVIRVSTPSRTNIKVAARRCQNNIKKRGIKEGQKKEFDFVFSIFHPFHLVPKSAVSCAKELNIPSIIKIDDAIYGKSSGIKSIQRGIEKMLNSKTLQNASRILVSNESTKNLVSEYYNVKQEKIAIVPNGVDLKRFPEKNDKRKKRIVFSGVMYFHRGLDLLLKAASEILQKNPDFEIVLVGEGPELEKLKDLVKDLGLESKIKFQGWVSHDEIPEILLDSSIGIGPLRSTPVTKNALPIKVLEYMAASLPILSANDTLPEDILIDGKNGFFIHDAAELAEKLDYLLKDEDKITQFGKNSRQMVSKFDWKNIVNQILNEYQHVKK